MPRMQGAPRLSVVAPCLGDPSEFEDTLVSALQNRPSRSEIVVALNRPYDDPYDLAGDVKFVSAPGERTIAGLLNAALVHTRAPIVHTLTCGAEFDDGWAEPAMERFVNERIAAVAPLVVDREQPEKILAVGVAHDPLGNPTLCGAGKEVLDDAVARSIVGPTLQAGFYRRDVLDLLGGWDVSLGDELADLDLALSIRRLGWRTALAHESLIRVDAARLAPRTRGASWTTAGVRERLLRRHNVVGTGHAVRVALEAILNVDPSPALARIWESSRTADRKAHAAKLAEIEKLLEHAPAYSLDDLQPPPAILPGPFRRADAPATSVPAPKRRWRAA